MNSPIEQYKTLMNVHNIKEIAYQTLFTKYIIENVIGEKKLWEIDSTDQEGLIRKLNGGYPLPGFIYTFIYPPTHIEDEIKIYDKTNIKKYIDFVPLVFCLSIEKNSFKGINLNTLPNLERLKFLETYYNGYKKFFKDIEKTTEADKLALNKAFISIAISGNSNEIIKLMNKISKANFSYGYRTYKTTKIKILRMIEYCEWNYIPFYDPKNAFKLMNQKQIHSLYYRTLNNNK
jgi:hypothetical protein